MVEYLEEYDNVLDKNFCNYIVEKFLEEKFTHDGVTIGGLNKQVKNSIDFYLKNNFNEIWKEIDKKLYEALTICINNYRDKYKAFQYFNNFKDTGFQIKRYIKGEGFYNNHNDFKADKEKYRILTFLFYLNDVENGGETEFLYGKFKIKPKAGKCILFPASWTFPHRALIPLSNDKFIISGWLHCFDIKDI